MNWTKFGQNLLRTYPKPSLSTASYSKVSFFKHYSSKLKTVNVRETLLELGENFNKTGQAQPFKGTLLVGVQHILATTIDMFSVLKTQGLESAILTGKSYSTHSKSAKELKKMYVGLIPEPEQMGYGRFDDSMREATYQVWNKALQKIKKRKYELIITLDDGADLLLSTPSKLFNDIRSKPETIIGIEQTRGGSNRSVFRGLPFPIINVAGSFIKNVIEYPKVARVVSQKISVLIKNEIEPQLLRKPVIGIIGKGSMGKALIEKLSAEGYTIFVYDKEEYQQDASIKAIRYPDSGLLIMSVDIIIGCTGQDITLSPGALNAFLYSTQNKWLISTSSKDIEFNKLLEAIRNQIEQPKQMLNPLKDIHYKNVVGAHLTVVRGGFPVNFDNSPHSVPPEDIWPTRAALLLACTMSANLHQTKHSILQTASILKLDAQGQLAILRKYQEYNPDNDFLKSFSTLSTEEALDYINEHSEGEKVSMDMENNASLKLKM